MPPNVLYRYTYYSKVNKPIDSFIYEYNLEFLFEGFKEQIFGVGISAFFSMKNLDTNEVTDLISSKSIFEFQTSDLTQEDVLWMLQATHYKLKNYPEAKQEGIEDVLNSFPEVSNETATFTNNLMEWFNDNKE